MNMFEQMPFSEKYPVFRKFCPHTPWRGRSPFSPFLNRMLKFSQLIVENSATSTASFKYFILQHQPLHSATSSALFSQRNCLFHPAKSNPSPSAVVSFNSMKRMNLRNDVHEAKEAHLMITRMLLKLRRDASFTASGRSKCCIGT